MILLALMASMAAGQLKNPWTDPAESDFQRAVTLYKSGFYEDAASLFQSVAEQYPLGPRASEATHFAEEARRRTPAPSRPEASSVARIELAAYGGLEGAMLGFSLSVLVVAVCCSSFASASGAVAVVPALSVLGAATGAGLGYRLAPPDLAAYRPQLAATLAFWGTILPLGGLIMASNASGPFGSTFVPEIGTLIVLGGPVIGFFSGYSLGAVVEVDSGRLSMVNSGALFGGFLSLLVVGGLVGLTGDDWPWISLAGAAGGALIAGAIGFAVRPSRGSVLITDVALVFGGLFGLLVDAIARPGGSPQGTALMMASGAVLGFSIAVAAQTLTQASSARIGETVVTPWAAPHGGGIAAAFRW